MLGQLFEGVIGLGLRQVVNAPFFPSFASQTMFYDIRVFDELGREVDHLRSDKPLVFEAVIQAIPPLGTSFRVIDDVDFYELQSGTLAFRMLADGRGLVEESSGLEIQLIQHVVDVGSSTFEGVVRITATGSRPARVCWFVTPVLGANLQGQEFAMDVAFDDGLDVNLRATFRSAEPRAGLIVQCFSSDGRQMEKHRVFIFRDLQSLA